MVREWSRVVANDPQGDSRDLWMETAPSQHSAGREKKLPSMHPLPAPPLKGTSCPSCSRHLSNMADPEESPVLTCVLKVDLPDLPVGGQPFFVTLHENGDISRHPTER